MPKFYKLFHVTKKQNKKIYFIKKELAFQKKFVKVRHFRPF